MLEPLPPDPYKALDLPENAQPDIIKKRYRELILKCHPDKVPESEKVEATNRFASVQNAWEILGDANKRDNYHSLVQQHKLAEELTRHHQPGRASGGPGFYSSPGAGGYSPPTAHGFASRGPSKPRYAYRETTTTYGSPPPPPPQTDAYFEPEFSRSSPHSREATREHRRNSAWDDSSSRERERGERTRERERTRGRERTRERERGDRDRDWDRERDRNRDRERDRGRVDSYQDRDDAYLEKDRERDSRAKKLDKDKKEKHKDKVDRKKREDEKDMSRSQTDNEERQARKEAKRMEEAQKKHEEEANKRAREKKRQERERREEERLKEKEELRQVELRLKEKKEKEEKLRRKAEKVAREAREYEEMKADREARLAEQERLAELDKIRERMAKKSLSTEDLDDMTADVRKLEKKARKDKEQRKDRSRDRDRDLDHDSIPRKERSSRSGKHQSSGSSGSPYPDQLGSSYEDRADAAKANAAKAKYESQLAEAEEYRNRHRVPTLSRSHTMPADGGDAYITSSPGGSGNRSTYKLHRAATMASPATYAHAHAQRRTSFDEYNDDIGPSATYVDPGQGSPFRSAKTTRHIDPRHVATAHYAEPATASYIVEPKYSEWSIPAGAERTRYRGAATSYPTGY